MPIDMSAATAPPKRSSRQATTTAQRKTSATVAGPSMAEQRYVGIAGVGQLLQAGCQWGKQYAQAATFGMHWPAIAKELAVLSDTQPTIARYVDMVITAGPYTALIMAALPFVMQTGANYGLIEGNGTTPPAVLESQMKAAIAQQEAEAMRAQQQAIRDAENAQREYTAMVERYEAERRIEAQKNVEANGWDAKLHDATTVSV
jgi:hypothetical protein